MSYVRILDAGFDNHIKTDLHQGRPANRWGILPALEVVTFHVEGIVVAAGLSDGYPLADVQDAGVQVPDVDVAAGIVGLGCDADLVTVLDESDILHRGMEFHARSYGCGGATLGGSTELVCGLEHDLSNVR
jgi:hypothetical protein